MSRRGSHIVPMPDGHDLDHDAAGLLGHVLAAITRALLMARLTLPSAA